MTDRIDPAFRPVQSVEIQLPAVFEKNQSRVKRSFWTKMRRVAGRIPFAEEAAAAYYCALDGETPFRVRATLMAALAYFVMPADAIPDIVAAVGFSDDATVLMMAISVVSAHLKPRHYDKARQALGKDQTPKKN